MTTLIRVAVHDTGGGIRASDLDRVFSALLTTKPGAMGVGRVDQPLDHQVHDGRLLTTPNAPPAERSSNSRCQPLEPRRSWRHPNRSMSSCWREQPKVR